MPKPRNIYRYDSNKKLIKKYKTMLECGNDIFMAPNTVKYYAENKVMDINREYLRFEIIKTK